MRKRTNQRSSESTVREANDAVPYEPGNTRDFERLYESCRGRIVGRLTSMLHDRGAAEDCCQDAFERAFKQWAHWKPIAPAEVWVHRIAVNAAISHQRKMRLREVGEVIRRLGRPEPPPLPEHHIEGQELAAAVATLPAPQASVVVLRHVHGYTNRSIARALGVPERTIASRLAMAKKRLRAMLRGPVDSEPSAQARPGAAFDPAA